MVIEEQKRKNHFSYFFFFHFRFFESSQPSSHLRRLYREESSEGWPLRLIALRKQSPLDDYKCRSHSKGFNLSLFSTRLLLKHNLEKKFISEFISPFLPILFLYSVVLLVVGLFIQWSIIALLVKYYNF